MDPISVGDTIDGKYKLTAQLGQGGMGVVYAALHRDLGELVALKFLLPALGDKPDIAERFLREARAGMRIKSPHVARVHDVGTASGAPFMVMEHLVGRDLAAVLDERGQMPVGECADLLLQACEAINEAHALSIVHRDLKPANVFVTTGPDTLPFVKVLDFGISKSLGEDDASLTSTRGVIGSPAYMSPEQLTASRKVDERTDVWSLGVILYEMLADTAPFPGSSVPDIHAAILHRAPVPLPEHREGLPSEIVALVAAALERDRDMRLPTVAAFATGLAPFGTEIARESLARIQRVATRGSSPPRPSDDATAGSILRDPTRAVPEPQGAANQPVVKAGPPSRARGLPRLRVAGLATTAVGALAAALLLWSRQPQPAATACAAGVSPDCEAACKAHAAGACEALAKALLHAEGAARDPTRAAALYQKECDAHSLSACSALGALYGNGDGVPHDDKRAVDLYTLACDGRYARGCLNLGAMHFDGTGFPNKDEVLGAQLFQRACDWGEPLACWSVSVGYRDGRGVPRNPSRASEFAAKACSGGVAEACLGPEPKLDMRELEAKCTQGIGAACERLADLYLGRTADAGVVADSLLGREYDKKACDLGVKKSCAATHVAPDVDMANNQAARANAMFESECNRGSLLGCTFLAENLVTANAVPADRDRANGLLDQACKGGVQKACDDLAKVGGR